MRAADIDWSVMRGTVVVLVVGVLVSGALIGGSLYFGKNMQRELAVQQTKLASIRDRYQTIDEEKRLIETYLPRFERLQARGILGEELRLNWIESLRASAERLKLPALRYEVAKQGAYNPGFELPIGSFRMYGSAMKVDAGLLHEEDLARMLRDLERRAAGMFTPEACVLTRTGREFVERPDAQNVHAECTLRWLTLRKPSPEA